MIDPGASDTPKLPALQAGTYQMWCPVPGHKEAGMQGSLVVGTTSSGSGMAGMPGMGSSSGQSMTAIQMATMHEASTKAFPAKTQGTGDQILQPTIVGGVKVFNLSLNKFAGRSPPANSRRP
jgi:hypothetical protein